MTDRLPSRLERIEFQLPVIALLFLGLVVALRSAGVAFFPFDALIYLGGFALALVGLVLSLIGLVVARLRCRSVRTWAESLLASVPVTILYATTWALGFLRAGIN
jgi:amino acid transporter